LEFTLIWAVAFGIDKACSRLEWRSTLPLVRSLRSHRELLSTVEVGQYIVIAARSSPSAARRRDDAGRPGLLGLCVVFASTMQ
jgi:hypothetical protein